MGVEAAQNKNLHAGGCGEAGALTQRQVQDMQMAHVRVNARIRFHPHVHVRGGEGRVGEGMESGGGGREMGGE